MEDNKRNNQDFDFLDLFRNELAGNIQILEKGLSKLEYDYVQENVEVLIDTVQAIKRGAYRASFPVLVELLQAMEDIFFYVRREEQSLAPSRVDCLFQADAVFRSILRQEKKNVSAWLVERESYIHRVRRVLRDFLEEKGITPSDYQEKTENGRDEHELTREEAREDAAEEKEETSEVVAAMPDTEARQELLFKLTPSDTYFSTDMQESASQAGEEPEADEEIDAPVVSEEKPEASQEIIMPVVKEEEPETGEEINVPIVKEEEPEASQEITMPVVKEEEPETGEEIDTPVASEDVPVDGATKTEPLPEVNDRGALLTNAPLYSEHLLRLAAECLVQTRRFRRQYPIFEEMKGSDPAKTMAAYYSAKGVRQHLEYLTEQLCEEILLQSKVPIGQMAHQFSVKVSQVTAAWDEKVDFISEGDTVLLDARILTELSDVLWHFLHAVLIDSAGTPIEDENGEKRRLPISSLGLIAEEKMEMVWISLLIENYHLRESWATQQSGGPSQVSQKEVQNRWDILGDQVISSGGAMDCVLSEKGTEIILQLPVSFAMIPCLPVQIHGASYALPFAYVKRLFNSTKEILSKTSKGYEIIYGGERILCITGEEISPPSEKDSRHYDDDMIVVILKNRQMKYGLIVDATMEKESLVLYPLDHRLGSIRGVLGTAMMADGSPTLIVDVPALFAIVKDRIS